MKVCVTLVGVCRPTLERIKANIEANIAYFTKTYPTHTFSFVILTYRNGFSEDLRPFCLERQVELHIIEPLEESKFEYKLRNPNWYRLFYSMECVMNFIPDNTYDCILRVRLDTEIRNFEIHDTVLEDTYYTVKEDGRNWCSDNIGYGSYKVMKRIWQLKHCATPGFNTEEILFNVLRKKRVVLRPFRFHFILYQSSDDTFDGVVQWSKRDREWKYDGIRYSIIY